MVRPLGALLLLAALTAAPPAAAEPGDEYTISALTIAPGSEAFEKFGHNALLVHDDRRRVDPDRVYNWGTFSFGEPGLIVKFLRGRLSYWLGVDDLRSTLLGALEENRGVVAQELDLTAAQKLELVRRVEENARPENTHYHYDYYTNNCTTKVRDLIDEVTHGALHAVSDGPSKWTFRDETSRLDADVLWEYVALNLAMSSTIDRPLTEWEEAFVPVRLEEMLRRARTERGPLVRSEKTLLADTRPPIRPDVPKRFGAFLGAGVTLGAGLGAFTAGALRALGRRKQRLLPALLGGVLMVLGGPTFVLGTIFVLLWACTDHRVAWHNENLFLVSPLALGLLIAAVRLLRGKASAIPVLRYTALGLTGFALLGVLVKALPWFRQANAEMLALFVPIWFGLALGAWRDSLRPSVQVPKS